MSAADLRTKDVAALQTLLASKREDVATAIREKRVSEKVDPNALRKLRREIAQIMTVMNEKKETV